MSEFDFCLEAARRAYRGIMAPFENSYGVVEFDSPIPLAERSVASNAKLFSNRFQMMSSIAANAIVAEIGVLRGDFSEYLINECKVESLHLFDIDFETHRVKERFKAAQKSGLVTFHDGSSHDTMIGLPNSYFDCIYIDAGHDYHDVYKDIEVSLPKLKAEGSLVFNDYIFWSHTEARQYGVIQAVNELVSSKEWHIVGFALHPSMYCDIAIARSGD
jgi:predicted O-methyltransferase YrrM